MGIAGFYSCSFETVAATQLWYGAHFANEEGADFLSDFLIVADTLIVRAFSLLRENDPDVECPNNDWRVFLLGWIDDLLIETKGRISGATAPKLTKRDLVSQQEALEQLLAKIRGTAASGFDMKAIADSPVNLNKVRRREPDAFSGQLFGFQLLPLSEKPHDVYFQTKTELEFFRRLIANRVECLLQIAHLLKEAESQRTGQWHGFDFCLDDRGPDDERALTSEFTKLRELALMTASGDLDWIDAEDELFDRMFDERWDDGWG
ncbi:MAG: hypothetical protein U1E26_06380 [Coriobacteriia bacterium]|nr:hypothetical protein [Coriobacteriia bacterium]